MLNYAIYPEQAMVLHFRIRRFVIRRIFKEPVTCGYQRLTDLSFVLYLFHGMMLYFIFTFAFHFWKKGRRKL
jgi:hypothetical protein